MWHPRCSVVEDSGSEVLGLCGQIFSCIFGTAYPTPADAFPKCLRKTKSHDNGGIVEFQTSEPPAAMPPPQFKNAFCRPCLCGISSVSSDREKNILLLLVRVLEKILFERGGDDCRSTQNVDSYGTPNTFMSFLKINLHERLAQFVLAT